MEGNNMERKVSEHDEIIHKNILPRVEALESFAAGFTEKVTILNSDVIKVQAGQSELGKGQKELEMTVKVENEKSRQVMEDTKRIADKLLDHVIEKDNVLTKAEQKRKDKQALSDAEIRKARWEIIGKIAVALVGGTSVIAVIIQAIF